MPVLDLPLKELGWDSCPDLTVISQLELVRIRFNLHYPSVYRHVPSRVLGTRTLICIQSAAH